MPGANRRYLLYGKQSGDGGDDRIRTYFTWVNGPVFSYELHPHNDVRVMKLSAICTDILSVALSSLATPPKVATRCRSRDE